MDQPRPLSRSERLKIAHDLVAVLDLPFPAQVEDDTPHAVTCIRFKRRHRVAEFQLCATGALTMHLGTLRKPQPCAVEDDIGRCREAVMEHLGVS